VTKVATCSNGEKIPENRIYGIWKQNLWQHKLVLHIISQLLFLPFSVLQVAPVLDENVPRFLGSLFRNGWIFLL